MKMSRSIERRRRKPDEIAAPRVAIRNHCLECVGYVGPEVERCTAPECWLYPWRMGTTPAEVRRVARPGAGDSLRKYRVGGGE